MVAILIMVVASVMIGAIMMNAMRTSQNGGSRAQRTASLAVAEDAVTRYLYALSREGLVSETDSWLLDQADFTALVEPGGSVIANASLLPTEMRTVHSSVPAAGRFTMAEPVATGGTGYWQVYRVDPPSLTDPDASSLVVYLRAWMGTPGSPKTSAPRTVRTEFRASRFSEYQLLSDVPIQFSLGARLRGPVHSNGFVSSTPAGTPVISGVGTVCSGADVVVSTAKGSITLPASCAAQPDTGRFINFEQVGESFARIVRDCGTRVASVVCLPGTAQRTILLGNGAISVDGVNYPVTAGSSLTVYASGRMMVSGTLTNARVTLAAQNTAGTADIVLTANTLYTGTATLGLLAQDDIIVGMPGALGTSCLTQVRAAMVAETGRLTIDPNVLTQSLTSGTPVVSCPGLIDIEGSVASHLKPMMRWGWIGTSLFTGYAQRQYDWDPQLRRNPPPYSPLTETWQVVAWKDANADCIDQAGRGCQ